MIDRLNSALEGRYRIERKLGEGGMATVYLAEDLRHARRVAVKVLRPELAAVVGAERFLAEIRTTASLQHPHILPLHDSGEADSFLFYVMPYVESEGLRERLDRERQLPVDEAVAIARKVADALQYAHEQGIIHRDVKPANILMSRGEPLVADFGIALALSEAGGGRITETGLSLGTPHYMSPEQATGERTLDPRSDVYALGCVLYEMLAGEPPFPGPTAQAVLARILTGEPRRVTDTRRTVPPHIDAAVSKALEKLPADRFDSAEEFAEALSDPSFQYSPVKRPAAAGGRHRGEEPGPGWLRGRWWVVPAAVLAAAVVGLAAVAAVVGSRRPVALTDAARSLPAHRYLVADSGEFNATDLGGVAISRDGTIAYVDKAGEDQRIMVRFPGQLRARPLEGSEGGYHPAFSPAGDWIVFAANTALRKVPTRGGPVVPVARGAVDLVHAPDWGPDGVIVFGQGDGLYRVPEVGGSAVRVAEATVPYGLRTPVILPDDAGWLAGLAATGSASGGSLDIVLVDPETGEAEVLIEGGSSPVWLPTGHVAFVHSSGSVFAAPFDLEERAFLTEPAPVIDSVHYGGGQRSFDVSEAGAAVYLTGTGGGATGEGRQVAFLGVAGGQTRVPPLERTDHFDGRFSPDGSKLAYTRDDHIWLYDIELGSHPRFTTEGANHHDPVWSPDGSRIAFGSERGETGVDIWVKDVGSDAPARPLLEMEGAQYPREWPAEDVLLIQSSAGLGAPADLYTLQVDGEGQLRPYLRADWNEALARVSTDGRWLAYQSGEGDVPAVLVRAFPEPGRAVAVSEPGVPAGTPVWSPDGGTLYYRRLATGEVVAAQISAGDSFEVTGRETVATVSGDIRDVHPDGRWILAFRTGTSEPGEAPRRVVGVANWFSELARRLGELP